MGEDTLLPRTAAGSAEWSSQGRQEAKAATATVPADAHNSGSPLMHLVLCNSLFRWGEGDMLILPTNTISHISSPLKKNSVTPVINYLGTVASAGRLLQ